jgi:low temperature requirement protein LtrA
LLLPDVVSRICFALCCGWVWTTLPGGVLILAAAFVPFEVRPVLWLVALAYDFVGPGLGSLRGWRVEPAHFAERHGLIIIIAIGESRSGSLMIEAPLLSGPRLAPPAMLCRC